MDDIREPENLADASAGSAPAESYDIEPGDVLRFLQEQGAAEDPSPETTTPEATGELSPADPLTTEEPAAASAGGTGTEPSRSASIPRERFDQVHTRWREAQQQLEALAPVQAWKDAVSLLAEQGYTPEQVLEAWQQMQAAPPSVAPTAAASAVAPPEATAPAADDPAAFDAWCAARDVDPYALTDEQYDLRKTQFEFEQRMQGAAAEAAQLRSLREQIERERADERTAAANARMEAERQAEVARWTGELTEVVGQHPVFQNEALKQDLVRAWRDDPEGRSFDHHAQALLARWLPHASAEQQRRATAARNELSRRAVAEHPAPPRPVTAGGTAVSPSEPVNYAQLDEYDMQDQVAQFMRAAALSGER